MTDPELGQQVAAHYDDVADEYQNRYEGERGRYFEQLETNYLLQMVDLEPPLLDLGTGSGRLLAHAVEMDVTPAVGIDISSGILKMARNTVSSDSIDFFRMDSQQLGFHDGTFETILCLGMFEYIDNLAPYFQEVRRVLTDDGHFAFSVHNANRIIPRDTSGNEAYSISEHSLESVRDALSTADMKLDRWQGSMWFNKGWWYAIGAAEKLPGQKPLKITNTAAIRLQRYMNKSKFLRYRSGSLLVSATPK